MTIDLNAIGTSLEKIGSQGKIDFAAADRIYQAYERLEPTTKASLVEDAHAVAAELALLETALHAFQADDDMAKIGALVTIASAVMTAFGVFQKIAVDGESVFGADWAVVKPDALLIYHSLKGTAT